MSKTMVIEVEPCVLEESIEAMPAMVENWLSSGVATADAMVSGSAPGSDADTTMVGKSTLGSSLTGRLKNPNTPKISTAAISSVVITGKRMNGSERFIARVRRRAAPLSPSFVQASDPVSGSRPACPAARAAARR